MMVDLRPQSTVQVRFQDCDLFGHLNNVNYITYFVNAREDHLRTFYQFDLFEHGRTYGANWVVTQHQIAYLRPALPGENVTIETGLVDLSDTGLRVEGVMADQTGRHMKAIQWTTFRHIDLSTGRPVRHPEVVQELLQSLVLDDVHLDDLNQRIRQLKRAPQAA